MKQYKRMTPKKVVNIEAWACYLLVHAVHFDTAQNLKVEESTGVSKSNPYYAAVLGMFHALFLMEHYDNCEMMHKHLDGEKKKVFDLIGKIGLDMAMLQFNVNHTPKHETFKI